MKQWASDLGFDLVGIARAEPLPDHRDHLLNWVEQGRHTGMKWLANNIELRCDPTQVLPGCKSVIVVGVNYYTDNPGDTPPFIPPYCVGGDSDEPIGRIARYAQFADYHKTIGKQVKKLTRKIDDEYGTESRRYVDTGPVLEKVWAQKAGIGFIGKNGCLINQRQGSWFLLGVILTPLELTPDKAIETDFCGTCSACIDACPTDAIVSPGVLDSGRCLSYLTIEHRDEIEDDLKSHFTEWLFGCDICQDVCPYNKKLAKKVFLSCEVGEEPQNFPPCEVGGELKEGSSSNILGDPIHPPALPLREILDLKDKDQLLDYIGRKSPLRRAGLEGLKRTAELITMNIKRKQI